MASDDESNKKAVKLETREEFPGWKLEGAQGPAGA